MDLRSSVCKEAIQLLVVLAAQFPTEFALNSIRYINAELSGPTAGGCMFRQLHNGKKLLADLANEGITAILATVCVPKAIDILAAQFKSKNALVRYRVACYFQIALRTYALEIIMKATNTLLSDFFTPGLEDQT